MNTPATFDRCVAHFLRSVHDFAPSYFDDVFIHSRSVNGKSDVEMHKENLSKLLALMPKTPRRRDIRVVRRHIYFSRVTTIGVTSTSGYASTTVLARYISA
ncbi:hypothetical protein PF003_g24260 [Phytophthora fragariae]|nr:hypothetical protein PF003_g24260 [Phytophthora fragariae]